MLNSDDNNTAAPAPIAFEPIKLAWGGPAPEGVTFAWGARAIYSLKSVDTKRAHAGRGMKGRVIVKAHTACEIDIVWDRVDAKGDPSDVRALCDWLDRYALKALRAECIKAYLTSDSSDSITVERDGYKLVASPRASYGYLYITAWKVA